MNPVEMGIAGFARRLPRAFASTAALVLVLAGARLTGVPAPAARGSDWPAFGRDPGRSNSSTAPTGIDGRTVASLQRQQIHVDGTVDASAIYLAGVPVNGQPHDALFVTTTYGKTLAIDAHAGSILWEYTPPDYASWAGSYRITQATPVADPGRTAIYAASPDGHIQKLSVADGHAEWSTAITRLPEREKIPAALNLFAGRVIATTGGYIGDRAPYQGHVAVLDAQSGRLLHVWNSLCSDRAELVEPHSCRGSGGAIWGRAGAVGDVSTGNIFVATGNGTWDGRTNWGDAVVELDRDAARILANYTPSNTEELDRNDEDLGSTSPALLGSGLVAQGGKDGRIRVLSLERIAGATGHRGGETSATETPSGADLFSAPAVWRNGNDVWIFAADNGATAAWVLRGGRLERKWRDGHPGTSPVLAGGLLYVYNPRGGLNVYEPGSGRIITTLECGTGHWNSPIVVDRTIVLPEGSGNAHKTTGIINIWRSAAR